jgi:hypothetical protein
MATIDISFTDPFIACTSDIVVNFSYVSGCHKNRLCKVSGYKNKSGRLTRLAGRQGLLACFVLHPCIVEVDVSQANMC